MAAREEGVEKRPASKTGEEVRVVNPNVNTDDETRTDPADLVDGLDDATRDLIVHDTTTRERTVNAKRAHEPLDVEAAEDRQPAEDGNGPRAAEIELGAGPTQTKSTVTVSEAQIKKGAPGV